VGAFALIKKFFFTETKRLDPEVVGFGDNAESSALSLKQEIEDEFLTYSLLNLTIKHGNTDFSVQVKK